MTLLVGSIFHMTRKIVSEMTYNVSMGTLNPTIPYHPYVRPSVRTYVRTYVRPSVHKKFFRFRWYLVCTGRGRWVMCTTVCRMTRSKVKVTRPLKLEILLFSKSISSATFNVSWQMTTDSETTEQYLTFVWSRFLISVLVFVSRDFELGKISIQFANAFAIAITFARWQRRYEATTVTYGTIFVVTFS